MLKICITGHRNLKNIEEVKSDINTTLLYFKEKHKDIEIYSSLAYGADTIFAQTAIEQGLNLKIVLPFQLEAYKNDFSGNDLNTFKGLIKNKNYQEYTELKSFDQKEKDQAYLAVGKHLVDICDVVVAVWDSKQAAGIGGTGDIVHYAREANKEIHLIKGIRIENETKVSDPGNVQLLFDTLDGEALSYKKKKFEPTWIVGIAAGVLAAFCFAVSIAFPTVKKYELILSIGEVVFLSISFTTLTFYANKWKAIFLEKRRNAEYLRTLLWYRDAGIPIPPIEEVDYKPNQSIIDIEGQINKEVIKIDNFENAKRVAWALAEEQAVYHRFTRIKIFESKLHLVESILKVIKITFVTIVVAILIYEIIEHSGIHLPIHMKYALKFCWLILPPIYAALEGIKYFNEWKRNIAISRKTIKRLEQIKSEILVCDDAGEFQILAGKLRAILELENSDWAERYNEKEIEFKS